MSRRSYGRTVEEELEICRKYRSGQKQSALALEHGTSQSVISRILKERSPVEFQFYRPFGTASFPNNSVNVQASGPPHVYPNGMHQSMHCPPVSLAQAEAAVSARPFNRPSREATSVPAHLYPNVYQSAMQSNADCALVPWTQQGWPAFSARPLADQAVCDAADPTGHSFSEEEASEICRRYLSGQKIHSLASEYAVPPSWICNLIHKYHSTGNLERSRPSITATSVPSHVAHSQGQDSHPSHLHSCGGRTGMPYAPGPLAQMGRAATLVSLSPSATQIFGMAKIDDGISHPTHSAMIIPSNRREPHSSSFTAGVSDSASFDGSNQFGSRAVHSSSDNQWITHPPSGKTIDAQNNGFTPGSRSMMDTDAETLSGREIRTQPPTNEGMTTLHSSEFQGYGSGQATLLLQTSYLPAACVCAIEDALRERVEQRVADSNTRKAILDQLATQMIHNIPHCEYLNVEGLMEIGFSKRESDLLIMDDNAWQARGDDWLETFMNSLPDFVLQNKEFLLRIKTAIINGNISSFVQFVASFEKLNLPAGTVVLLRKFFQERQSELNFNPQITSDSSDAQTLLIDATNSVPVPNDGAGSKVDNEDEVMSDSHDTPKADELLSIEILRSLSDGQGQPGERSRSQAEGSGSQVLHHGCQAQSAVEGLETSQGSEVANSSEKVSTDTLEGCGTGCLPPQHSTVDKRKLFCAVLKCFPNLGGAIEGVSGTMRPIAQVKILSAVVQGLQAVTESKIEHSKIRFDFLDLGCSSGHTLACAATLDFFAAIYGVDLPSNKVVLLNHFKLFMCNVQKNQMLSLYVNQLQNIEMRWANAGDQSKQNISELFGLDSIHSSAVYWFNVGWNDGDILNSARILSKSPQVLVIAAVMRGNDSSGHELLHNLNENLAEEHKFQLWKKLANLSMSGGGSFTAYIIVRGLRVATVQCCEIEDSLLALPQKGQRVEVLFSDYKWYPGEVTSFDGTSGQINFDDGTFGKFNHGESDVFFMPRENLQWKHSSCLEQDSKVFDFKFCIACSLPVDEKTGYLCARCNSTAACVGCARSGRYAGSICFICRAELADLGRSQLLPCEFEMRESGSMDRGIVCNGCGDCLSNVLSEKVSIKNKFCLCRFCNMPYGHCCTSLTPSTLNSASFACPACVGALCHDAGLKLQVEAMSTEMKKCLTDISLMARNSFIQDEWGYAVTSLQINSQSDLLCGVLPMAVNLLKYQVREGMDPSIGPFNFLNLMVLMDGSDLAKHELFQKVNEMFVTNAMVRAQKKSSKKRLRRSKASTVCKVQAGQPVRNDRYKLGFATADMRETPWWSLMKVSLIQLADIYDLHIFSRPPCDLEGDPHFKILRSVSTIVDFHQATGDGEVAATIRENPVDALVDAGGPTTNSFSGVMALRPAKVQMAHLGFPGDQSGGHIDWSLADQYTVDPDGIQGVGGQERFAFLPFYQPNASFRCDAVSISDQAARRTARSDWGLSEGRFVFAIFCRLGRVDSEQAACIARILKRSPNSDLWLRPTPRYALLRLLGVFRSNGIARSRIILAFDVPADVHQERIRHADLGLDTRMYGAHTTCSDFLRNTVAVLALKGDWWHTRVAYGLVFALLGNDDLVANDLSEFEVKAVHYSQGEGLSKLQGQIRPEIQCALQNHSSIFDGPTWTSAFQRIVSEAIRQVRNGEPLKDIYSVERIRSAPIKNRRESVFVLGSSKVDKLKSTNLRQSSSRSESIDHDDDASKPVAISADASEEAQQGPELERAEITRRRPNKAKECRLQWLFDAAQSDAASARMKALDYIQKNQPEHAENIDYIKDTAGNRVPHIQLPCTVPRIHIDTGNVVGCDELPFLYVVKGAHGRHLYCGQEYRGGMVFTKYDGKLVPSDEVKDATWTRSLNFKGYAVDGRGFGDYAQMENNSLGHIANHSTHRSVAKYSHRLCRAHVSRYCESIFLTARRNGLAWTEITADYTAGSAERDHNIPRVLVVAGVDHIDSKDLASLPPLVQAGAQVLRRELGYDLLRVCGRGSFAGVIAASFRGEHFALKIGNEDYSKCSRLSVLVDAAVVGLAEKFQDKHRFGAEEFGTLKETHRLGAEEFGTFAPRLRDVVGCPAALLNVEGQRIAVMAMELADSSGREIFRRLGERFKAVDHERDQCLQTDVCSVAKGILRVVRAAHSAGLVHGDLKWDNILLRKLSAIPSDRRVIYCILKGEIFQILLCDWSLSRWSCEGTAAAHVFSAAGKEHSSIHFHRSCEGADSVVGVGLKELQVAFGLKLKKSYNFRHPGGGTDWIQAPEDDSQCEIGVEQRRQGQARDVWSNGAMLARLVIAPNRSDTDMRDWRRRLIESSRQAYEIEQTASESAAKKKKLESSPGTYGSNRAVAAAAAAAAAARPFCSHRPPELWFETMVRRYYDASPQHFLIRRIEGEHGTRWRSLLEVVQKLLSWKSEDRLKFAEKALLHPFFVEPELSTSVNQS